MLCPHKLQPAGLEEVHPRMVWVRNERGYVRHQQCSCLITLESITNSVSQEKSRLDPAGHRWQREENWPLLCHKLMYVTSRCVFYCWNTKKGRKTWCEWTAASASRPRLCGNACEGVRMWLAAYSCLFMNSTETQCQINASADWQNWNAYYIESLTWSSHHCRKLADDPSVKEWFDFVLLCSAPRDLCQM